jgi:hypothetical protein
MDVLSTIMRLGVWSWVLRWILPRFQAIAPLPAQLGQLGNKLLFRLVAVGCGVNHGEPFTAVLGILFPALGGV